VGEGQVVRHGTRISDELVAVAGKLELGRRSALKDRETL
jgi:hypothetical protein